MAINSNVLAENQATVLAEDGNVMYATIQMRHGKESEMDKSKYVPAEMGVATDTKKAFMAFSPGDVKEIMFREDSEIEELLGEVRKISDQAVEAVESAEVTAKQAIEDYTDQMKATIPEDYTEMVKKVDILERTKAPAIHQTAVGNPITLTDAGEGTPVVDFSMEGKTEQVQTTGAQLLDVDQYYSDFKQDDGTYYATNQDFNNIRIPVTSDMIGKEYTFSADVEIEPGGSLSYLVIIANISETNVYGDRTTDKAKLKVSGTIETENDYFAISYGAGISNIKVKNIMFNSGSEALPYEPYTGGQSSPSPEYPQEIVNAGKYNEDTQKWEHEVSVGGANLINILEAKTPQGEVPSNITNNGFDLENSDSNSSGRIVYIPVDLKKGKQYVIKIKADSKVSTYLPELNQYGIKYGSAFIPKDNTNKIAIYVDRDVYGTFSVSDIMLNEGSEPLPYESYRTPQNVLIQSDRPLTKWDRLEKRDGQWGWVFKSGEIEFDGSEDENWWISVKNNYQTFGFTKTDVAGTGGYCDKFIDNKAVASGSGNVIGVSCLTAQRIYVANGVSEELTEFKTWLQSNPLNIWYQTSEETFVPLTESEQSALEALTTYFPTTIIANDADCEMEIEYVADTKTFIENKFAELAQNLAATQNTLLEV